ncbi:MAG: outer membrane protein assembly factor BamD [Bryobacterales bacterium]|nr:outer membrane protein assembly factor BamD [Bryobacteraceae bacterium]MDW8354419.1 outer membrane protein assembly factor BamD [Bryobacterales bacterium]
MRNGSLGFAGRLLACLVAVGLLTSCGFRRKKYENPITKDTLQPDKILFDKAIQDIEKGRYEVARLTLQTLISTYDTSEFLAKAKLALADSWFREGGSHGLAQAEAEYKDFILFYPTLEEAAEAQMKVCMIHYRQMEKPDRDTMRALRAEDECRQLIVQFPNSKFVPEAQQRLREIQEVLAEHEYRVGSFYHTKGSYVPAANRLQALTDHYRLYSKADQALWKLGDSYEKLGPRFRDRSAAAYARIVRDYPLSPLVEQAKRKLEQMEQPIPEPDPVALARMKYELENYRKPGLMSHFWGIFRKSPDVRAAAKSGEPIMTTLRPTLPVSVPAAAEGAGAVSAEVTVAPITGPSALDTKPDARRNPPQEAAPQGRGQTPRAPESREQKKNDGRNNE